MLEDTLLKLIGNKIAELRKEKGLTQENLAKKIGFDAAASISNIEKGARSIFLVDLYKLAEVLDQDIHSFLPSLKELKNSVPSIEKEKNALSSKDRKVVEDLEKMLGKERKDKQCLPRLALKKKP